MQLTLISNPDASQAPAYQIARVIYAQTNARSLTLVEAFASMIANISRASGLDVLKIVSDKTIFDSLDEASVRHELLSVPANDHGFQMCLRTVSRMLAGGLPDCCFGATKFHYSDSIPDWATCRGYIADIDDVLFYL
ncbi:MAG: hypothetical protein J6R22_03325 [Alphaproteobacteria bacterium]|nr:hypothetical protein [Alphaproteobacteria bacterium]